MGESGDKVIVVTFNYRVGPYGFLASEELQEEGNLNIGIHDQRAAIRWVQRHISQFGGDPDKVTLFGTSVGGGSVLLQTLAYGGNSAIADASDDARWNAGVAAAVYMPSFYRVEDLQFQYDQFLKATNCTSLSCLRALDSDQIQKSNVGRPPFPWSIRSTAMLKAGNFSKDRPLIIGSSHTEGTIFVSQANTTTDIQSFLLTQYPDLTSDDILRATSLYSSEPMTLPGVTVKESELYFRLARMYGDAVFSCPALEFAATLSQANVPIYLFRDHILDPVEVAAGYIVPHTWEVQAVWGPDYATQYVALEGANSYDVNKVNHPMVNLVQKYWTGFAGALGDVGLTPNSMRAKNSPIWLPYNGLDRGQRLKLQANATRMERITSLEIEQCNFWNSVSARTHT
ncbi:Alpha/Beta hydrolase protein [Lipomyces doorenjongii]